MQLRLKNASIAARLILATILGVGIFAVWFFCFVMGELTVRPYLGHSSSRSLVFTSDGEPLFEIYPAGYQGGVDPIYQTLTGQLLRETEDLAFLENPQDTIPPADKSAVPLNDWTMRMLGFAALSPTKSYWYLIHDLDPRDSALFVGYDARTRRQIGYFSRRGFSIERPAAEDAFQIPFAQFLDGAWEARGGMRGTVPEYDVTRRENIFLICAGELLQINLSEQSIKRIALPDKVVSIAGYTTSLPKADPSRSRGEDRLVVRLPAELRTYSLQGEPLGNIPLEPDMRDKSLELRELNSGEFIVEASNPNERYAPREIAWYAADGKRLRKETVLVNEPPADDPLGDWIMTGILPIPLLLAASFPLAAYSDVQRGAAPDMASAVSALTARFWLPYLTLTLGCLALAIWTHRRHRRYEKHGALAWAVFVLLLGPLGLVAYLVHRPWPVRSTCEHCGRPSPRNRGTCLACDEPFAAPELRGIEVFG